MGVWLSLDYHSHMRWALYCMCVWWGGFIPTRHKHLQIFWLQYCATVWIQSLDEIKMSFLWELSEHTTAHLAETKNVNNIKNWRSFTHTQKASRWHDLKIIWYSLNEYFSQIFVANLFLLKILNTRLESFFILSWVYGHRNECTKNIIKMRAQKFLSFG